MLTEDYVSYEVAKLLKEKGFNEATFYDYNERGIRWFEEVLVNHNSQGGIACPILQMAIKWLREVHNIHIEVKYFFEPHIYKYTITYTPVALDNISSHPQCFNTYEEACEAAIKYCLENLI